MCLQIRMPLAPVPPSKLVDGGDGGADRAATHPPSSTTVPVLVQRGMHAYYACVLGMHAH